MGDLPLCDADQGVEGIAVQREDLRRRYAASQIGEEEDLDIEVASRRLVIEPTYT